MPYRFGAFRIDPQREQLFKGDRPVPLNRKAVRLLAVLLEHHGQLVSKSDLLHSVWPDKPATLNNLSQHVFMLRQALGEEADGRQYVLTVPGQGYRFVAPLEGGQGDSAARIIARHYCEVAEEFFERRTRSSIERAIELYDRALQFDASCAAAFAGLALCRYLLADYLFESPREMLARAERDAMRTLESDRRNPAALIVLARAAMQLRYRWSEAETLLLDAFRSDADYLWAHVHLVEHYAARGRLGHARQALAHARSLGVRDDALPRLPLLQGMLHYFGRSFDAAQAELTALLEKHPQYALARFVLAKLLLAQRRSGEALEQVALVLRVPFDPLSQGQPDVRRRALALSVHAHALRGDAQGMRAAAAALDDEASRLAPSFFSDMIVAMAYGRPGKAIRALDSAIAGRESLTCFAAVEPLLEPLHGQPGWREALRKMNLEPISTLIN